MKDRLIRYSKIVGAYALNVFFMVMSYNDVGFEKTMIGFLAMTLALIMVKE